jgi:hypothetical protein
MEPVKGEACLDLCFDAWGARHNGIGELPEAREQHCIESDSELPIGIRKVITAAVR